MVKFDQLQLPRPDRHALSASDNKGDPAMKKV